MKLSAMLLFLALGFQVTAQGQSDFESLSPETHEAFLGQMIGLLGNEDLLKEMEIIPSQIVEIKQRIESAKQSYRSSITEAEKRRKETGDYGHYNETLMTAFREYTGGWERTLEEVLLPHQHEQLHRLVIWSMIKKSSQGDFTRRPHWPFHSVLLSPAVQQLVGIDDSQAKRVHEHAEQMQDEYAKDLAALHDKYEEKMQEKLTAEQREKLKELVGETPAFIFR